MDRAETWADPRTIASGIRVPNSRADRLVLGALRESQGAAVTVDDDEILETVKLIARKAGIFASPEGAAAVAGARRLIERGYMDPSSSVVAVNTAGGSRYRFLLGA